VDIGLGHEQRLHPLSWLFVLLQQLRQFILPLAALVVFGQRGDGDPWWMHLVSLVVVVVLVAVSVAQYLSVRYCIGEDAITVRNGLLERNRREIPFARIHNVVVEQNPLHRLFGVAELKLESAGGDKPEAHMRVLRLEQALALEQLVRQRGRAAASAQAHVATTLDEGQPPPLPVAGEAQAQVLLRLSSWDVVKLGLLSNRGWILVAAALGSLTQVLPRGVLSDAVEYGGREAFGYANGLLTGTAALALLAAVGLLLGWLLLRVLSVAMALLRYHGFTLTEQDRRLTVVSGLLNRVRSSVARRRIQSWSLQETLLQRWAGVRQLRIDSAAGQTQGHPEAQRGLRELAPLATPERCDALVRSVLPHSQWPPQAWQGMPLRGSWRLCLTSLWFTPLLAAGLTWRWGPMGLLVLAWLPLALWSARRQMARMGWYRDNHYIAVRGGWWNRWWRWAELDKLQVLQLQRSPLDRALGTASLWLDTAGAGAGTPLCLRYLPHAQAQALLDELGPLLARRQLRW